MYMQKENLNQCPKKFQPEKYLFLRVTQMQAVEHQMLGLFYETIETLKKSAFSLHYELR